MTTAIKIGRLTASDRASQGVYQDLSGPAIEDALRELFPDATFVPRLLPDERDRLSAEVNDLTAQAYLTKKLKLESDGTPWRPFVHIRDISKAMICAIEAPADAAALPQHPCLDMEPDLFCGGDAG